MAYYEGDPNGQNGQGFPQEQSNMQGQSGMNQGQQQFNQNQQQFNQNQQFNQGQQNFNQQYQQQSYQQPYVNFVDTGHSPAQIMVFGIISIASGFLFGWTLIVGIVAIIFGALSMSWAKKWMEANPGVENGQIKAGRICGIIGLIFGILGIVGSIIALLTIGCAGCFYALDGYY